MVIPSHQETYSFFSTENMEIADYLQEGDIGFKKPKAKKKGINCFSHLFLAYEEIWNFNNKEELSKTLEELLGQRKP